MSVEDWLFIPGTLCDERVFAPLLDHLGDTVSGTVRVIEALDEAELSVLAARVVKGLGPQVRIVGFSLGCQVAFEIMRQVPNRCAGVTLISSTARPDQPELARDRRAMVKRFQNDGAETLVEADLWPRYVAEPQRAEHRTKNQIHSMARQTSDGEFAAQIELAINRPDSRPVLSRFEAPVLMVNGREDILTPVELGAEIATTARKGTHRIIPGAGHFVLLERPEEVALVIKEWITEVNHK